MCKKVSIRGGATLTSNLNKSSLSLIRNKSSTTTNSIYNTSFCCIFLWRKEYE